MISSVIAPPQRGGVLSLSRGSVCMASVRTCVCVRRSYRRVLALRVCAGRTCVGGSLREAGALVVLVDPEIFIEKIKCNNI